MRGAEPEAGLSGASGSAASRSSRLASNPEPGGTLTPPASGAASRRAARSERSSITDTVARIAPETTTPVTMPARILNIGPRPCRLGPSRACSRLAPLDGATQA